MAILFIPLLGIILILCMWVLNTGQVSMATTEVAAASDIAALGSASWIASGQQEGVWVARKMLSTIAMAQALYLVPFCPSAVRVDYPNLLWDSIAGELGLVNYFGGTANAVMEDAWRMGRQASFSLFFNNMLMSNYPSGFNPTDTQEQLYAQNGAGPSSVAFDWQVGDSPPRRHNAQFDMSYPAKPYLRKNAFNLDYYVWLEQSAGNEIKCFHGQGYVGMGPLAATNLPGNPLRMVGLNPARQEKAYEVVPFTGPNATQMPQLANMNYLPGKPLGDGCGEPVCLLQAEVTTEQDVMPIGIVNGSAAVNVTGAHSIDEDGGGGGIGWGMIFPTVTRTGTARVNAIPNWNKTTWIWPVYDVEGGHAGAEL